MARQGPAGVNAFLRSGHRGKIGGGREVIGSHLDTDEICHVQHLFGCLDPDGQDHHIVVLFDLASLLVDIPQPQITVFSVRLDTMHPATDKTDTELILGLLVIFIKPLAMGTHIHIEDGRRKAGHLLLDH